MIRRKQFQLGKVTRDGAAGKEKAEYRIRLEQALMFILGIMISLFILSRRIPYRQKKEWGLGVFSVLSIDMMPATTQGGILRPPTLPKVPVPSEDEYLPEDETIDSTRLNILEGIGLFDGEGIIGGGGRGSGFGGGMGPRPIGDVIPEYPEEEMKRGVEGVVELAILVNDMGRVDSVQVLTNTTLSKSLERAAIQAAYRSRYLPARRDGRRISRWIRRPYRFERK